jgi:hypothetical protein
MKLFKLPVLFLAITILIIGCKKKETTTPNYFSFGGKSYTITAAVLGTFQIYLSTDSPKVHNVYQMGFLSVSGTDSVTLLLAVADTATNVLTGNYPSNSLNTLARGIIPEAVYSLTASAISLIELSKTELYYTGLGGSITIALTGSTYTISMNAISAGVYSNFNPTSGPVQYNEIGTISGKYTGPLEAVSFTSMNQMQNYLVTKSRTSAFH